jgi:hypothetical protein
MLIWYFETNKPAEVSAFIVSCQTTVSAVKDIRISTYQTCKCILASALKRETETHTHCRVESQLFKYRDFGVWLINKQRVNQVCRCSVPSTIYSPIFACYSFKTTDLGSIYDRPVKVDVSKVILKSTV